ncbi:unnamed protein product [Amoebophrya sp. A120]|nr:unnamed protein product [Amoebophrya sp. A120]|eukprot:GSA120T00025864001.1
MSSMTSETVLHSLQHKGTLRQFFSWIGAGPRPGAQQCGRTHPTGSFDKQGRTKSYQSEKSPLPISKSKSVMRDLCAQIQSV